MDNSRAILLMIAAMAAFTVTDVFTKIARESYQASQLTAVTSFITAMIFILMIWRKGERILHAKALNTAHVIRTLGEVIGGFCIVVAFGKLEFSTIIVLAQAHPLAVTLGAAMFLGEIVGWRRWMAVALGFIGVLIILRPVAGQFDIDLLWMVVFIFAFSARDLASKALPAEISTPFAVAWSMIILGLLGSFIMPFDGGWQKVEFVNASIFIAIAVSVGVAMWLLTSALRIGEVSAVSPFRYTRVPLALLVAWVLFDDVPDLMTWLGTILIIGSGYYAFWRERRVQIARA